MLMLLEALDEASRGKFSESVVINSPLSVEHILPQSPRAGSWPLPEGDSDELLPRRRRLTHALGNLTLLTQPLNSSVRNGPYDEKQPCIVKDSLLPMNTYFQKVEQWDEDAIVTRGRHLAGLALKVWPHPSAGN